MNKEIAESKDADINKELNKEEIEFEKKRQTIVLENANQVQIEMEDE